jgi:hypothetical protein
MPHCDAQSPDEEHERRDTQAAVRAELAAALAERERLERQSRSPSSPSPSPS